MYTYYIQVISRPESQNHESKKKVLSFYFFLNHENFSSIHDSATLVCEFGRDFTKPYNCTTRYVLCTTSTIHEPEPHHKHLLQLHKLNMLQYIIQVTLRPDSQNHKSKTKVKLQFFS